ncbi:tetraacyldisaccharide 4'-kinase [Candidatus Pelagibacter sp.]|nr:tetraacyldisaccharide 4'-kinase [Candidatus Pelagibacter sp.]
MKFNKPNFWDLDKPNFLAKILLPFTIPIIINNLLPKKKFYKKNIKTICVGNIYLGGTGKTPVSMKIHKILKKLNYKVAFIKKDYTDQKDEQNLLKKNGILFSENTRLDSLNKAITKKINYAIFDDGLQDKNINYDITIVCFNAKNWIGNGQLIPSGPLRERINSLRKYDAIFLNGNRNNNLHIKSLIKEKFPHINIFEAIYVPLNLNKINIHKKYLIFSGIGNPESFKTTLQNNKINVLQSLEYPDHYNYDNQDINKIRKIAKKTNANILTTEKDYMRLSKANSKNIQFLKIELQIKDEKKFINFLKSKI